MTRMEWERKQMILSRRQLADLTGLSVSCVYRYEKGLRAPSLKQAMQISKVLHIPVESLLDKVKSGG